VTYIPASESETAWKSSAHQERGIDGGTRKGSDGRAYSYWDKLNWRRQGKGEEDPIMESHRMLCVPWRLQPILPHPNLLPASFFFPLLSVSCVLSCACENVLREPAYPGTKISVPWRGYSHIGTIIRIKKSEYGRSTSSSEVPPRYRGSKISNEVGSH
jgi:hypothetical protein